MAGPITAKDVSEIRRGAAAAVGALVVTTVVSALAAAWGVMNQFPPLVIAILIGLAVFLGYFAVLLSRPWWGRGMVSAALSTSAGRKAFTDGLVVFHAQGVQLQTGPTAAWQTDKDMRDWLVASGQWVGEILGHMRAFGCSHSEIHDIGTLTPPRHVKGFRIPVNPTTPQAWIMFYQDMTTERLHRIKELMKKYGG